jgi:hypothetical protein
MAMCRGLRKETTAWIFLIALVVTLDVAAWDPGSVGRQQRQQAAGWLQLEQDQKTFREDAQPLQPSTADRLDQLERRQQLDLRALDQQQRQALDRNRNLRRGTGAKTPSVTLKRDLRGGREDERQRLKMRIQRDTLFPGLQ